MPITHIHSQIRPLYPAQRRPGENPIIGGRRSSRGLFQSHYFTRTRSPASLPGAQLVLASRFPARPLAAAARNKIARFWQKNHIQIAVSGAGNSKDVKALVNAIRHAVRARFFRSAPLLLPCSQRCFFCVNSGASFRSWPYAVAARPLVQAP